VGTYAEPLTWNLHLSVDQVSIAISKQIHAALVRINSQTQEIEPQLAESWGFSEDGTALTFHLRSGVVFSDGHPFTAEDVAFTFKALHDPDVASPLAETARIGDQALVPEILDELTVRFEIPHRTAVVERIFGGIHILPAHRLKAALEDGSFHSAFGVGVPPEEIAGLGPFVLERYLPGQRVVLRRNSRYWKQGPQGESLPLLDGIIFEILPDSNARLLKFSAGELDIQGALSPEDFSSLRERESSRLRLLDLGPGTRPERFWLNVNPRSPTLSSEKRAWFEDARFRRAISLAIDRSSIIEAVYHGYATPAAGSVSPANWMWHNDAIPPLTLDREEARRLLKEAGFHWDSDGALRSRMNTPVGFTLITTVESRHRARMAAIIQEDLAQIGIDLNVAPLDRTDLIVRITQSFDYEACLLGITQTDPDPSDGLPMWLSHAPLHFWNPSQERPATGWEAQIDTLMERQMNAIDVAERKELFDEVQMILAREMPLIELVVPHALIGVSDRVENLKPTPFWTPPLWNSEEISLSQR
jgi:peptide/nickel transport system substrate-binding protein